MTSDEFGPALRETLDDMLETMYEEIGVGLAAPQVGISKRMIVIDYERDDEGGRPGNPMYLVNPEIIWKSEEKVCGTEGCLSVPEQRAEVERFAAIKVKYQDADGHEHVVETDDFLGDCFTA